MKNTKKKVLAVACALGAISAGAALVACGDSDKGSEKYLPDYTFPDKAAHAVDKGVVIDGKLDDAIYKNQRWLEINKEHGGETATMRMTSYYGEEGVYLGFDVTESCRIYVNHARASYFNSGVEMYLAMEGTASINADSSFEVDMEADGTLTFKRNIKGGWGKVHAPSDVMAKLATTTKGGAVNEEKCYGYTHELFIPYDYLVYLGVMNEGERPQELYVNPVLISSYSYAGTKLNVDRHWYNTVAEQIDGDGWGTPSTNYHFDKNGLVSHDINIKSSGAGSVSEIRGYDYAVDKNNLTLKAEAKSGNRIKSFIINGKERKGDLVDGMITLPMIKADVNVEAVFEKIPTTKGTLSGTVDYTGADSAFFDDAQVVAFDGSNSYTTDIDADTGAYSLQVPYGDYKVSVVSITGGYNMSSVNRTLMAATGNANFEIDDTMYGAARTLYFNDVVISGGNKDIFSNAESPIASEQFVYKTFLGLSEDARNISTINKYVTEQWLYCGENWMRLQIMNWEGGYIVKLIWMDGTEKNAAVNITGSAKDLMNKLNGLYLAVIRNGENITIAYLNASGNWSNIITDQPVTPFANGAALTRINLCTQEGVSGDYPTASYGGMLIQGTTDPTRLPAVEVNAEYDVDKLTIEGLESAYAIGSTVSFNATPAEGYVIKGYLNGAELEKSGEGYSFTMLGRADLRFDVVKNDPQDLSVNIRGYKFGEYIDLDGVQAELKGIKDYTATIQKGVLAVEGIIPGEYELVIPGYGTKIVNMGKDENVSLAFSMFPNNAQWNLNEQNSASPVIHTSAGKTSISSQSYFGDFYMETVIKYNARLAATASSTTADEYTQRRGYNLTSSDGRTLQPSLNYHSIQFAPLAGDSAVGGSNWDSVYNLTADEIERYHSATGIKFGVMRIGRNVSILIDGKPRAQFNLPSDFDEKTASVGYHLFLGRGLGKEALAFNFDETVSRDIKVSEESVIEDCTIELDGAPQVGDDVKIKIKPTSSTAGATLITFNVNGREYASAYDDGVVTIEGCAHNELIITAKYAKPMFDVTIEQGNWDLSGLDEGVVVGRNWGVLDFGNKTNFMAKTTFKSDSSYNTARREFILFFPEVKKCISFGAIQGESEAFIQSVGDEGEYKALYPWWNMLNERTFNESELAKYYGDGLEMMIVRQGANIYLFIDGVWERTFSLSGLGSNAETMACNLKMRTWEGGLSDQPSKLAFDDEASKYISGAVVIDDEIVGGSVTANSLTYNPLNKETVTLTLVPEEGYKVKSLTVNGKDVTDKVVDGTYSFIGMAHQAEVTAEFVEAVGVATSKIAVAAVDEVGNAVKIPAGIEFKFTNLPNGLQYTATSTANGGFTFSDGESTLTEIPALTYVVTSTHCNRTVVEVTADGATAAIAYRTVSATCSVVANTGDVNLAALVGMNRVLAFERWISQWDTAIDTSDNDSLLSGCRYWRLNGTETARPENTTYGAITNAGGYLVKGLKNQTAYESWAPVIKTESVSKVTVRKDVTKLRVYAGKWWGANSDVTFSLCIGDNVYASKTVTMGVNNGHAVIEFEFDTTNMDENARIEFDLKISSNGSDGYAIAGLQLLGKI